MFGDFLTVYRAEILRRVRSRPFLIGLIVGVVGIALIIELPLWLGGSPGADQRRVVLAGPPSLTTPARTLLGSEYTIVSVTTNAAPPSRAWMRSGSSGRVIVLHELRGRLHVTVYSTNPGSVDTNLIAQLLLPLQIGLAEHLDPVRVQRIANVSVGVRSVDSKFRSASDQSLAHGVAFTLIFLLYLLVIVNSQLTMAGVVEEKTNRIAELLVASVDPMALLYGKILAGSTLAVVQMIAWATAAFAIGALSLPGYNAAAQASTASPITMSSLSHIAFGPLIAAFVFFLVVGLLQFSTIFASMASLISRPEDLGSIATALVLPVVAALIVAITALDAPNLPLVVASSFVPLLAPFTMFARIAAGEPPLWEIAVSAIINVAALYLIAIFAARLYRVGMLLYGRPPRLRQVLTTLFART
jgi:ABC-type Na+ efflux pump permease subunit